MALSDSVFSKVTLTARSLAVLVKISRELWNDSANIDQALMTSLTGAFAVELDRVALLGSGTPPEPKGIFNTSGIGSVSMGTNGALLTNYNPLVDAALALANANADTPSAFIMAPRTYANFNKLADTTGQPMMPPPIVADIPRLQTTSVPVNQTQGSSSVASCIIGGVFSDLLIGIRAQLQIEVLRELFAGTMQYALLAHLRADIQLARPASFVKVIGVL